jgi:prophage regulatory protein
MSNSIAPTRLLRIRTVLDRVPLCRTKWYQLIKEGAAPAPVALGCRAVAWREADIDAFIANLSEGGK